MVDYDHVILREKCPNMEIFLVSIFPEYGDLLRKSRYLVRMRENMDQKNNKNITQKTERF